jgi:hypothetical protein
MRDGIIPVGLNTAAEPDDRFGIRHNLQFCEADHHQPIENKHVTRREAKRLGHVRLDLGPASNIKLAHSDLRVSLGALRDVAAHAIAEYMPWEAITMHHVAEATAAFGQEVILTRDLDLAGA